ncbi:MAG: V-type ATPase subunit [Thermoplasmata archaeon]|nr:MAG: V-type ATPase subunit [Thermoplasmata archaeon]
MGLMEIIEELVLKDTLAFALLVIGVAVLITIILLMSYFNILITIASFSYPNARLRAMGNPFVTKKRLTELLELSSSQEAALEISKEGYKLPPNIEKVGLDEAERLIELTHVEFLKKVLASDPQSLRPFLEAYLIKYDAMQVKKALRAKKNGMSFEDLKMRLVPVKEIDEEIIENMLEAGSVDEVISAVKSTRFGDTLSKTAGEYKDDIVALDLALDQFFSKELRLSITRVDTSVSETVTLFIGKHADITNLKHIIRSKQQGLDPQTTERFLVEGGRILALWKLRQLIEVKGIPEMITELEGTPYLEIMRNAMQDYNVSRSIYSFEMALDKLLLTEAQEISSSALIAAGPTIKFIVAKEFEVRNIKAVLRGMHEGLSPERIMPMLIMEEGI